MMYYNEREGGPAAQPSDRPAGALTACFWHLGVRVDNRGEAAWGAGPAYRYITERPFIV